MPPSETFCLCQITYYLQTLYRDQVDISTRTFHENRYLYGPGTRGSILELYTLFTDQGSKHSCQLAWETDLGRL